MIIQNSKCKQERLSLQLIENVINQASKEMIIILNKQKNNKTVKHLSSRSTSSLTASILPTTKLIIYESPSNNKNDQNLKNTDYVSLPIRIASAALDGVNSVTKLLNSNSTENSCNFTVSNESSPSPSLTYSSEATINLVNNSKQKVFIFILIN